MDACQWHGSFRDADGWCRRAEPLVVLFLLDPSG